MRHRGLFYLGAFSALALVSACAEDFDATRQPPPRGTLGEELYGVLCDRVGAQALHEDLTGASFHAICHKDGTGAYGNKVDETLLPPASQGAVDTTGKAVSVDTQQQNRASAVARVEALGRRRGDLIVALDATFPDVKVPVKDVNNPDPSKSCNAPSGSASGENRFHDELSSMLGRFQDLYNDGTIPQSTESLATLMNAFKAAPDAQTALARFDSRQGYRPIDITLGAARPVIAYPQLRDLSNATLSLMSADSNPYDGAQTKDDQGNRIPIPGAAYPQFSKLLEVAHQELRVVQADPVLPGIAGADAKEAGTDRFVLSRPRSNLEVAQELIMTQNDAFGGGAPRYIVRRDARGYAQVPLIGGVIPAPFVDGDKDGLPDVDDLGRFVTSTGAPPLSPFFAVEAPEPQNAARDMFGRATDGSQPLYAYVDTSHTFAASLLSDLKPLVNPDTSQKHETLMYAVAGAQVLFGSRDGATQTTKTYDAGADGTPVQVAYSAFHPDDSALVDLVYALGNILGDKTTDDTLSYTSTLFQKQLPQLARVAGAALSVKAIADKHSEAKIPGSSVFWDEMIDVVVQIGKEPGLLEDILRALGDDSSLTLGPILGNYMNFDDRISYDRKNLNGGPFNLTTNTSDEMKTPVDRTQPDTGFNRSALQRFSQLVVDTTGVTACNKDNAVVHALGVPLVNAIDMPLFGGTYKECEVFKIENLATFYLDAIVGRATLYFRPSLLRNGIVGIGAATVDTIQQSAGISGFWDDPTSKTFRPKPAWLNRLVFFDLANDSTHPGDNNFVTNHFLTDLNGPTIGTAVCPERVIDDPDPTAADANPDGKIHGLRSCADGDSIQQRGADTLFTWENFGFYKAMTPLLTAFANHKREDIFLNLMAALSKHWADDKGTVNECRLPDGKTCSKDGLVTYEQLVAEALSTDILPALHDLTNILVTQTISRCDAVDPTSHACTKTSNVNGIDVMAAATRALIDPDISKAAGLKDRTGGTTSLRNDGTTNPQITPLYLLTTALSNADKAFDTWAGAHPDDKDRQPMWHTARSQLVDQFLAVNGTGANSTFVNQALPQITPTLIDITRAQLFAHCPTSFTAPFDRCDWARDELTTKLSNVVKGPTFAATVDLADAVRKDDDARTQLEALLTYLLNSASQNQALPAMLASTADIVQLLKDDTNLVPLYHVLSQATSASEKDATGHITKKSMVDAQMALLARISGKAFDSKGNELCNHELDPNQILTVALSNLVTPMTGPDGKPGQTPLEVIMDVVADVNRTAPDQSDKLQAADYANIADNVSDFLLNKERGLEQFYEIVRQGTVH